MIGTLTKLKEGWYVKFFEDGTVIHTYLPLHPDNVKQINRDAQVFDNIEARIAAYPNVDFEIVKVWERNTDRNIPTLDDFEHYAKLIPSKEQQKQLITEIMEEDAKDGLYEDASHRGNPRPDDVEKLAANLANPNGDKTDNWKEGYLYAKETLYTEEQVRELLYYYDLEIKKHLLNYTIEHSLHSKMCDGINDVRNTYIQSLKQPKKD
jgi:hypothetical protein